MNRDIFLRTLCLVAVTLFFTSAGASQGEIILAVNTLLMQLFTLFSYVMDGLAYAGEALSGRYIGARNWEAFTDTVRHLFGWGAVIAVLFTLVYALGGNAFLGLLTDDKEVIAVADTYFLLGACRARRRDSRLHLGRHLYRCHRHARNAPLHGSGSCQLFYLILWAASRPGKPCSMACLPHLPADAGSGADRLEPGSHPTGISQQEGTCLA